LGFPKVPITGEHGLADIAHMAWDRGERVSEYVRRFSEEPVDVIQGCYYLSPDITIRETGEFDRETVLSIMSSEQWHHYVGSLAGLQYDAFVQQLLVLWNMGTAEAYAINSVVEMPIGGNHRRDILERWFKMVRLRRIELDVHLQRQQAVLVFLVARGLRLQEIEAEDMREFGDGMLSEMVNILADMGKPGLLAAGFAPRVHAQIDKVSADALTTPYVGKKKLLPALNDDMGVIRRSERRGRWDGFMNRLDDAIGGRTWYAPTSVVSSESGSRSSSYGSFGT